MVLLIGASLDPYKFLTITVEDVVLYKEISFTKEALSQPSSCLIQATTCELDSRVITVGFTG